MAAPNLIGATTIIGKSIGSNLTSNAAVTILSNAASSNKLFKINTLNVSNYSSSAASITIRFHDAASLGGNGFPIVGGVSVPGNSTLNVIDKTSQYYLEENESLGAIAGTANVLAITCSYEDIS